MNSEKAMTGTVARVALLLKVLAEAEGDLSVAQVSEKMKLPTSTGHRLLGLLVETGLAERGGRAGSYRLSFEFLRLSGLVVGRIDVTAVAEPFMKTVASATGETCIFNLYRPSDGMGMIAKIVHGRHPLRYESQPFQIAPLAFGATGRAILAFLPRESAQKSLDVAGVSPTSGMPVDFQILESELAEIRKKGYALTKGQRIPGAVGLGAPVFNGAGLVVGALCISLPETRFDDSKELELANTMVEQARKMSEVLGYMPNRAD
ncbi:IclR family transcriptional regulator [Variovorax sp. LT1R20]|uniref:IclR family transcriptional regulator n=1 Tax=Variovorax sp. LT1R20 TaxID=3443729 RepID=UPI003F471077